MVALWTGVKKEGIRNLFQYYAWHRTIVFGLVSFSLKGQPTRLGDWHCRNTSNWRYRVRMRICKYIVTSLGMAWVPTLLCSRPVLHILQQKNKIKENGNLQRIWLVALYLGGFNFGSRCFIARVCRLSVCRVSTYPYINYKLSHTIFTCPYILIAWIGNICCVRIW